MVDFLGVNFVNNWESFELIDYLYDNYPGLFSANKCHL